MVEKSGNIHRANFLEIGRAGKIFLSVLIDEWGKLISPTVCTRYVAIS